MHTRASENNIINWLRLVQSSIDVLHFYDADVSRTRIVR